MFWTMLRRWSGGVSCYRTSGVLLPAGAGDVTLGVPGWGSCRCKCRGSGKTTLVNLLLRHHDPDVGQVSWMVSRRRRSLLPLRRCVSASQRGGVVNVSIADNLRLAVPAFRW